MANFKWDMSEKEWARYKKENDERIYDSMNCYGCFECGALRFEFAHTMDESAWYPYINVFIYGVGGYDVLANGKPYAHDEVWDTPLKADTFEGFKADCEALATKEIEGNTRYAEYANMPFGDWR